MRYKHFTYFLLISLLLISCSKEEDVIAQNPELEEYLDKTWEEEEIDGASVTVKGFEPGNNFTRSTWYFDNQKLIFGWKQGDGIGIFPTAKNALEATEETWDNVNPGLVRPDEEDESTLHPLYASDHTLCLTKTNRSNPTPFYVTSPKDGSQTAQLFGNMGEYQWDDQVRWTAYFPYRLIKQEPNYTNVTFEWESDTHIQTQNGIPDISRLVKSGQSATVCTDLQYLASERTACNHLAGEDIMISAEMVWSGSRINFQLRHIGAVARFFLLAPKNEDLVLTNLKLICDKEIFYKGGQFTMKSHPYVADESQNYGVNLVGTVNSQVTPNETTKTKMLQMNFVDGTAKTVYDPSDSYKRYVTAYMMMFPITYNSASDGNLYAYVTAYRADDPGRTELHFVSKCLTDISMVSGKYYQWTSSTKLQDGFYPIELTATLLPWQDIVGGNINADLTK